MGFDALADRVAPHTSSAAYNAHTSPHIHATATGWRYIPGALLDIRWWPIGGLQ